MSNIIVLTGAGISAESGIKTFRDSNGLWEDHDVMEVATPEGFKKNPELVHRFYSQRRAQLKEVEPNAAHVALAEFEKEFDGQFMLVTQNVDDLHERAGSKNVIHMHGQLDQVRCCNKGTVQKWTEDCTVNDRCDCCDEPSRLRPNIVWFGEIPFHMDLIQDEIDRCTLFISIGTSGQVYPAAGFAGMARGVGAHTVQLNLEDTGGMFDETITGKASEIVPEFLNSIKD